MNIIKKRFPKNRLSKTIIIGLTMTWILIIMYLTQKWSLHHYRNASKLQVDSEMNPKNIYFFIMGWDIQLGGSYSRNVFTVIWFNEKTRIFDLKKLNWIDREIVMVINEKNSRRFAWLSPRESHTFLHRQKRSSASCPINTNQIIFTICRL